MKVLIFGGKRCAEMSEEKVKGTMIKEILVPIIDSFNPPIAVDRFYTEHRDAKLRLSGMVDGPIFFDHKENVTSEDGTEVEARYFRPTCVVDVRGAAVWQVFFAGLSALDPRNEELEKIFSEHPEFRENILTSLRELLNMWGDAHE